MMTFWQRLWRAAKLDVDFYREVAEDAATGGQAKWVVVLYGMAAAMGGFGKAGAVAVNIGLISTILGWYVWAFSTYYIGSRFAAESDTPRNRKAVIRGIGYAVAPGLIRVLGVIPELGKIIFLAAAIWTLAAGILATKSSLNYASTPRAAVVCLGGWILGLIVQGLLMILLFTAFGLTGAKS